MTGQALRVYGADEFRQTQDENLIFFNTTGQDYRLAAGDVLRVTLRGFEEVDQTAQIGRDGFLVLSNLPPIQVSGHTIGEVEEQLLDILRLDDASASAYLTLRHGTFNHGSSLWECERSADAGRAGLYASEPHFFLCRRNCGQCIPAQCDFK